MQYWYLASALLTDGTASPFLPIHVCGKILPAVLEAETYLSARLSFSHRH